MTRLRVSTESLLKALFFIYILSTSQVISVTLKSQDTLVHSDSHHRRHHATPVEKTSSSSLSADDQNLEDGLLLITQDSGTKKAVEFCKEGCEQVSKGMEGFNKLAKLATDGAEAAKAAKAAGSAMKALGTLCSVLEVLGPAMAVLGAAVAIVTLFVPQKSDLDVMLDAIQDVEKHILDALDEQFASLKADEQKLLYVVAERHVIDAANYLHQMQLAKVQINGTTPSIVVNQSMYDFYQMAFRERMSTTGLDDLEALLSIYRPSSSFLDKSLFEVMIETLTGSEGDFLQQVASILHLTLTAFLNLQAYYAMLAREDPTKNYTVGITQYYTDTMTEANTLINSLQTQIHVKSAANLVSQFKSSVGSCNTGAGHPDYLTARSCAQGTFESMRNLSEGSWRIAVTCMPLISSYYPNLNSPGPAYSITAGNDYLHCILYYALWECDGKVNDAFQLINNLNNNAPVFPPSMFGVLSKQTAFVVQSNFNNIMQAEFYYKQSPTYLQAWIFSAVNASLCMYT